MLYSLGVAAKISDQKQAGEREDENRQLDRKACFVSLRWQPPANYKDLNADRVSP